MSPSVSSGDAAARVAPGALHHDREDEGKGARVVEELLTERLILRRPTPADVDLLFGLHSDRRACRHNPADMLSTRGEADALYRSWDRHWREHGFGYWVIHREQDRVGVCGVKVMTLRGHDVLNLLYRLDPSMWGRGYATEAALAVVRWADAHRPDDPVIARVRPANVASQRVAEKAGLRRATDLDTPGEDGVDWVFTRRYPG